MAAFLVPLLIIFSFNAYACVLPLQTVSQMDCSSSTEDQARQTCDAFLEIGPLSQLSAHHVASPFTLDCAVPIQGRGTFVFICQATPPPRDVDTPLHVSIPSTVLRI
jgi:hypothetical protein